MTTLKGGWKPPPPVFDGGWKPPLLVFKGSWKPPPLNLSLSFSPPTKPLCLCASVVYLLPSPPQEHQHDRHKPVQVRRRLPGRSV